MSCTHIAPMKEVWMIPNRKMLAKLMVIQGVSQRDVATAVGWKSHTYVGRILSGDVKTVTPEAAVRIALFLGVGVDDLFMPRTSSVTRQIVKSNTTRTRVAA